MLLAKFAGPNIVVESLLVVLQRHKLQTLLSRLGDDLPPTIASLPCPIRRGPCLLSGRGKFIHHKQLLSGLGPSLTKKNSCSPFPTPVFLSRPRQLESIIAFSLPLINSIAPTEASLPSVFLPLDNGKS